MKWASSGFSPLSVSSNSGVFYVDKFYVLFSAHVWPSLVFRLFIYWDLGYAGVVFVSRSSRYVYFILNFYECYRKLRMSRHYYLYI